MKKTLFLIILCNYLCATTAQNVVFTQQMIDSLVLIDNWQKERAEIEPIIKKIYMQDVSNIYIEQHYYPNGQLYHQVQVKDGKPMGLYKEYFSNGQLRYTCVVENGKIIYNTFNPTCIYYDILGNIVSCVLYIKKGKKIYEYTIFLSSFGAPCYHLFIYVVTNNPVNKLVSEYTFFDGSWTKRAYHCKPVKNSDNLFHLFLKEWEHLGYNRIIEL